MLSFYYSLSAVEAVQRAWSQGLALLKLVQDQSKNDLTNALPLMISLSPAQQVQTLKTH